MIIRTISKQPIKISSNKEFQPFITFALNEDKNQTYKY